MATSELSIIRGDRSYTPASYVAAFGSLPPEADRIIRRQAATANTKSQQRPATPGPQREVDAQVAALRRLATQPGGRELSRKSMLAEIAKGGPDITPAGGHGATGRADAHHGSPVTDAQTSMIRELRAQGMEPVKRKR